MPVSNSILSYLSNACTVVSTRTEAHPLLSTSQSARGLRPKRQRRAERATSWPLVASAVYRVCGSNVLRPPRTQAVAVLGYWRAALLQELEVVGQGPCFKSFKCAGDVSRGASLLVFRVASEELVAIPYYTQLRTLQECVIHDSIVTFWYKASGRTYCVGVSGVVLANALAFSESRIAS